MDGFGVHARLFPIEDHKIMIVAERGAEEMNRIKAFMLQREEVEDFQWHTQVCGISCGLSSVLHLLRGLFLLVFEEVLLHNLFAKRTSPLC